MHLPVRQETRMHPAVQILTHRSHPLEPQTRRRRHLLTHPPTALPAGQNYMRAINRAGIG